jgi:hypothetical protein
MKFLLFFFFLFAIYNNARVSSKFRQPGIINNTNNLAGTDVKSTAVNNGIGAATSIGIGLATNLNVATNVQTNVKTGDVKIGKLY